MTPKERTDKLMDRLRLGPHPYSPGWKEFWSGCFEDAIREAKAETKEAAAKVVERHFESCREYPELAALIRAMKEAE